MPSPESQLPLDDEAQPVSGAPDADLDTSSSVPADVRTLSYEQARDELVSVVNALEQGGSTLEESLALWERGEALASRCEEWLIGARARLDAARGRTDQSAGSA